jgi:hypothetical protein
MFTLPELIEYFQGQYTEAQIIESLEKLNAVPDSNGQYPIGVPQDLEAAFMLSQEAVKQLPGANIEETQKLAIQLAEQRAIELNLDNDRLDDVVQLIVGEGMAEAVFKYQLKQQVIDRVTADLESQGLEELTGRNAEKIAKITTILGDPDNLDKIIQEFGGTSEAEVTRRQQNLASEPSFDVEAFFAEVQDKKKPTTVEITSIQDVRAISAALLQRYKKPSSGLKAAGL